MKLNLLSILFSLVTICVSAQITVTNTTFPVAGDTLKTVFDGMPVNIDINPAGGTIDGVWNFGNLQGMLRETVFRSASEGTAADEFPGANLVTSFGVAGENYYKTTDNTFSLIGYQGPDPANLGLNLSVHINPPLVEKKAPLNFTDSYSDEGAVLVPIAASDIPGGLLDSFPIAPDSIRIRIAIERSGFVEGWGNLTIPGGSYDVLREKRVELTETRLDVKIGTGPFAVWLDVTDVVGLDFLGGDTTTTYNFYDENAKEAIAIVTVDNIDNDQVLFVEYKYNDVMTNVRYVNNGKPDILAYPNPAMEDIRLEFMNLNSGDYSVKIYNILGVEVWKNQYTVNGNRIVRIDVSNFRKGTYLYSLVNENGKTISTKRLIVMRP
jgi:type IX secretion system substrate protein